jgi:glycosyltransferase involved in cell wall biosynthesis
VHLEGTAGIPLASLRELATRVRTVVSVHDFSLFGGVPSRDRRAIVEEILGLATAVVFPSVFLRDSHREAFPGPGMRDHVIEPGLDPPKLPPKYGGAALRIAFAGSVREDKGAALLPSVMAACADRNAEWLVFGGGDEKILRMLRKQPRVTLHGYYRAGSLPALLVERGVGLVLLPSIVPESFSLTLSECWLAGVPAIAFDHGAQAERIARHGGGWTLPVESGAGGLAAVVGQWLNGTLGTAMPAAVPSAAEAGRRHLELYRSLATT